jgi:hypothetical protein
MHYTTPDPVKPCEAARLVQVEQAGDRGGVKPTRRLTLPVASPDRPYGGTPDRALRHDSPAGRRDALRRDLPERRDRRLRRQAGSAGVGLFCDDPPSRSLFHRLAFDEVWHFYAGDPLRLVLLHPDGSGEEVVLSGDVVGGRRVQHVVQAGRLAGA